jgi:hypothetical protein
MELKGKIIQKMPLATGEGKNGTWKKQEYVIEIPNGNYAPKKVCFSIWGDKIDQFAIHEQEELSVSFDLESREYNGRWYTDVRAWKVSRQNSNQSDTPSYQDNIPEYTQEPASNTNTTEIDDDLPF